MFSVRTLNSRITSVQRILSPDGLQAEIPLRPAARDVVLRARREIAQVLNGNDGRLILVAGPCSIHDPVAAVTYAERLSELARRVADSLLIVMRVYVEKPRTRFGWKGLINDPWLDGSHDLNGGLRMARGLMAEVLDTCLPIGCEFLEPATPSYLCDAVAWAAIGARTVQSQVHRQLASGLDMPVGIKNTTYGHVEDAIDALIAIRRGHVFSGIGGDGTLAVITTSGNPDSHVVLRGSSTAPNYGPVDVARTLHLLKEAGLPGRLFIDASHGNSGKDHRRQTQVVADVAQRIAAGERGIAGVMLESFLVGGRQDLTLGRSGELRFGQSVTDACLGWTETVRMVELLAEAVAARRSVFAA